METGTGEPPWEREIAAGPPDFSEPSERPGRIVALDDVETLASGREGVPYVVRDLGRAAGSVRHVVSRPPGTRVAHAFVAGPEGLSYLAYGTRDPNDIAYYPRSNKIYFRGVGVMTRLERLDYWEG